jgi:hypothetical protein
MLDYCRAITMFSRSSCEIRFSTSSLRSVWITTACTVPVNALFSTGTSTVTVSRASCQRRIFHQDRRPLLLFFRPGPSPRHCRQYRVWRFRLSRGRLRRIYRNPFAASRSAAGVWHGPPNVLDAPNPTSSRSTIKTFGAPCGGRNTSIGANLESGSFASYASPVWLRATKIMRGA